MGSGEEDESRRGRGLRAGPGILDESLEPHRCATASAVMTFAIGSRVRRSLSLRSPGAPLPGVASLRRDREAWPRDLRGRYGTDRARDPFHRPGFGPGP